MLYKEFFKELESLVNYDPSISVNIKSGVYLSDISDIHEAILKYVDWTGAVVYWENLVSEAYWKVAGLPLWASEGITFGVSSESIVEPAYKICEHEYVNVSFVGLKMVCKHCDKEQQS